MAASAAPTNAVNVIRHVVLYDGDCSLCTFQMKVLTWLDWLNVAQLVPLNDPLASHMAPNVGREQLLEAVHCVTSDGTIHRGARCIRFIGMRMPLLVPLALILWIPGIIWVAERVYACISRNRHVLSRLFGCKTACAIMPTREVLGSQTSDAPSDKPEQR